MRTNNVYKPGDLVRCVVPKEVPDENIFLWKYINGLTKDVYTFTTTIIDDFKYITTTAPSEDSNLLLKYNDMVEYIRIGNPPVNLILHYIKYKDSETLDYEQYDYSSNLLNQGELSDIGDNFYIAPDITVQSSFYNVMGNIITLTLPSSYLTLCDVNEGTVLLQRGNWQLIALPYEGNVAEDFIDILADNQGVPAEDLVEICSAYPGHINKFLSYIPGFTNKSSEHNFKLYYTDNSSHENTAFWIKCKEWTHTTDDILFSW